MSSLCERCQEVIGERGAFYRDEGRPAICLPCASASFLEMEKDISDLEQEAEKKEKEVADLHQEIGEKDREIEAAFTDGKEEGEKEAYEEMGRDVVSLLRWGLAVGADPDDLRAGIFDGGRFLSAEVDEVVRGALPGLRLEKPRRDLACAWCESRMGPCPVELVSGEMICRACATRLGWRGESLAPLTLSTFSAPVDASPGGLPVPQSAPACAGGAPVKPRRGRPKKGAP